MVAASTILSNNVITVSALESLASQYFIAGEFAGARGDAEGSLAVLIVGWCDSRPPCDISCEEQLSIRYITFRHGTTEKTSLQCKVYHILCTLAHIGVAFLCQLLGRSGPTVLQVCANSDETMSVCGRL